MKSMKQRTIGFDLEKKFRELQLVPAMEALVIANSTVIVGIFIYQFISPGSLVLPFLSIDLDLSLIVILLIWVSLLLEPIGFGLIVLGWVFSGIYAKKKYGDNSASILLKGSAIPVTFILLSLGLILISLAFIDILTIFLVFQIFLFIGVFFIFSAILTVMGIIISQLFTFDEANPSVYSLDREYLILNVVPQGEKIEYCPFRSEGGGCSYLGYTAPSQPLICDYKSTFLRCQVYAHIYNQIEEVKHEIQ